MTPISRELHDKVLQPDVISQYLDSEAPAKMQQLCVAINENYIELLEEHVRSNGKNAHVEASLNNIEEQLKFHGYYTHEATIERRMAQDLLRQCAKSLG